MKKVRVSRFYFLALAGLAACSGESGNLHGERGGANEKAQPIVESFSDAVMRKNHWDYSDAPERMGLESKDYEVHFASLPTEGELSRTPWSGGYWPTNNGGVTYRWHHSAEDDGERIYYELLDWDKLADVNIAELSPAEKYDIYLGNRNWDITRLERKRTDIMAALEGKEIPFWEGLCHAWASAAYDFDSPGPVTLKGPSGIEVPFGSGDIQALLTYMLHFSESKTYLASLRCDVDEEALHEQMKSGEITRKEFREIMDSPECGGIHAGAFHILLVNFIALRDEGFIADTTRDQQVWNQPVYAFQSEVVKERTESISADAAPGTVKEVLVKTTMTYTVEVAPAWERLMIDWGHRRAHYKYWLELDMLGNIIGGHWVSHDRPDFLWRREPSGFFKGAFAPVRKIYEESVRDLHSEPSSESPPRFEDLDWEIEEGLVMHSVRVKGKVPEGVKRLELAVIKQGGETKTTTKIRVRQHRSFNRLINVWRWDAGTMLLSGYDAQGKKLVVAEKSFP